MKIPSTVWQIAAVFFVLLATELTGCTVAPLRFQIIDEKSKLPLAGADMKETNINPNWFDFQPRSIVYPVSGADGIIKTDRLRPDFQNFFDFGEDGYIESQAALNSDGTSVSYGIGAATSYVKISPDSKGLMIIPMRRLPMVK